MTDTEQEVELKLAIHGAFSLPDLTDDEAVAEVRQDASQDLWAVYWDTADLRLARHGVTLRRRTGEPSGPRWTLKLPLPNDGAEPGNGDGILARREIEMKGPADRVPERAADLVTAYARTAPLTEIAKLRTRRQIWSLLDGAGQVVAELDDDEVSVMEHGRTISRFRELELESRGLEDPDLQRIAELLRSAGAVDAEPIPKVVRALGPAATAPADAVPPEIGPDRTAGAAVRAAMTDAVDRIVRNDAGMRIGDVESLHQARVGTRRLRSHLRAFRPLLDPSWADELDSELRSLARQLGEVRDLDVLIERLGGLVADLRPVIDPLLDDLGRRREASGRALLQRLRDERYAALLERLVAASAAPRLLRVASRPAGVTLPPLFEAAWKRLAKHAEGMSPAWIDPDFHRLRILAKRARYAADAVGPSLDASRQEGADGIRKRLTALQTLLGELQDAATAREEILAASARHPENGPFNLAAGMTLERESQRAAAARALVPDAWRELRRPRHRRWVTA
jgi:CHAD domain-containing protein